MEHFSIVVRRTFFELEADVDNFPAGRGRAFSDSFKFAVGFDDDLKSDKVSDDSTSVGSCAGETSNMSSLFTDETPRSRCADLWADEDEALPASARNIPCVWIAAPELDVSSVALSTVSPKPRRVCRSSEHVPAFCDSQPDTRTTVMLRNLPSSFTRASLLETLGEKGFHGSVDFVYVPVDFASGACLGYAFANFIDHPTAMMALSCLCGFKAWQGSCSQKTMDTCWSDPQQGIIMLIERFRNSRVMHGMVPDEFKPALFQDGVRMPFPANTKRVRPPYSGNARK